MDARLRPSPPPSTPSATCHATVTLFHLWVPGYADENKSNMAGRGWRLTGVELYESSRCALCRVKVFRLTKEASVESAASGPPADYFRAHSALPE